MNPLTRSGRVPELALIVMALIVLGGMTGCSALKHTESKQTNSASLITVVSIKPGVKIDGIAVGGLSASDAAKAVKTVIQSKYGKIVFRFRDTGGGDSYHYSLSDFRGYFDVDSAVKQAQNGPANKDTSLGLKIDGRLVALHLSRVAELWRVPVQEPKVKFTPDGREVTSGHAGRTLDQTAAYNAVMANLPTLSSPAAVVDIPFKISKPIVLPDQTMGLADTLVSFTTTFNPGNGTRTNNLLLAVKNINGTVVGPGEVFSYNDSVGPRTQQTGFEDAIIYVNNRMRKDVGGGICQASSTLYNCVLLANLPIVERHAHSLPVHYVPAGRDATVAWGGDDFRFRNNTSKPIIIKAEATHGGSLTESLIGDRNALPHPDAKVAIDVTPQRPYEDGYAVNSFRVVKEDGVLIAREPLGISVYHKLVGGVPH
jgi:vancomycin resistance protein YoaR